MPAVAKDEMKSIVITGSTRGIGSGLADAFLALGCTLTISGRSQEAVEQAVERSSHKYDPDRILGLPCDVTDYEQVKALWIRAKAHFGGIDIWINNAGSGHEQKKMWLHSPQRMRTVVETNLLGTIHGSMVAIEGMLQQEHGALYNMLGMGSDGRKHDGLTVYGTTKYGLRYFTDSLVKETTGTPLIVGSLNPGMVMTDLVVKQFQDRPEEWERAKRVFNIIADRAETVTPWLARQILANRKSGACIAWMTRGKLMRRFLTAPFRKRDLFAEPARDAGERE